MKHPAMICAERGKQMTKPLFIPCMQICDERTALRTVLERYIAAYPAFRIKPEGAPGSQARIEQERLMALEDDAVQALRHK